MPRGKDAKSVTKVILDNSCNEHESIVGWACEITDECSTRGASNEIHSCNSNMNDSYEREVISRHQPNNETVFESEHMLHILSEGEKEVVNEQERILQPQERGWQKFLQIFLIPLSRSSNTHLAFAKNFDLSLGEVSVTVHDNNLTKLQGKKTNSSEIDHASMPLGLFASKSVSCRISKSDLHKKVAFTLAEVLITLGVIGVVAAFTIPSLIQKYQMKNFEVAFKKQYSVLNNAINYIQLNNNLSECYVTVIKVIYQGNLVDNYSGNNSDCVALKNELISNLKLTPISQYSGFTSKSKVRADGGVMINGSIDYYSALMYSSNFYLLPDGAVVMFSDSDVRPFFYNDLIFIDVNGAKGPNRWGYDVFCLTLVSKNGVLRLSDEYASIAEKGGKLPRTILLNEKENNTNFKQYGVW